MKLRQENELIQNIANERNRIFERKIIYDLKRENDDLWKKLIQKSEQEAIHHTQSHKNLTSIQTQKTLPSQAHIEKEEDEYIKRYEKFIFNLSSASQSHIQSSMDIKSSNLNQEVEFYKTKCEEL